MNKKYMKGNDKQGGISENNINLGESWSSYCEDG